jgi:hypothetical protein
MGLPRARRQHRRHLPEPELHRASIVAAEVTAALDQLEAAAERINTSLSALEALPPRKDRPDAH